MLSAAVFLSIYASVQVVREQPGVWQVFQEPRPALIERLKSYLEIEESYVSTLLAYGMTNLVFVRARLSQLIELQRERSDAILGSISKVGLFPSALAAILAVVTAVKGDPPLWAIALTGIGTLLLLLNQNAATSIHIATVDVKLMLGLLDRAINLQNSLPESADASANLNRTPTRRSST